MIVGLTALAGIDKRLDEIGKLGCQIIKLINVHLGFQLVSWVCSKIEIKCFEYKRSKLCLVLIKCFVMFNVF